MLIILVLTVDARLSIALLGYELYLHSSLQLGRRHPVQRLVSILDNAIPSNLTQKQPFKRKFNVYCFQTIISVRKKA